MATVLSLLINLTITLIFYLHVWLGVVDSTIFVVRIGSVRNDLGLHRSDPSHLLSCNRLVRVGGVGDVLEKEQNRSGPTHIFFMQ